VCVWWAVFYGLVLEIQSPEGSRDERQTLKEFEKAVCFPEWGFLAPPHGLL
jgi:hypothetical protein